MIQARQTSASFIKFATCQGYAGRVRNRAVSRTGIWFHSFRCQNVRKSPRRLNRIQEKEKPDVLLSARSDNLLVIYWLSIGLRYTVVTDADVINTRSLKPRGNRRAAPRPFPAQPSSWRLIPVGNYNLKSAPVVPWQHIPAEIIGAPFNGNWIVRQPGQ